MATAIETGNVLQDAALVVDVCMSVEDGDVVTIICDDERRVLEEIVGLDCGCHRSPRSLD